MLNLFWSIGLCAVLVIPGIACSEESTIDQLARAVVCLESPVRTPSGTLEVRLATGFLLWSRDRQYLVTVAHAARDISLSTKLIASAGSGKPDTLSYARFSGLSEVSGWMFSDWADVAILELAASADRSALQLLSITRSNMWTDVTPPSRDVPVLVLGFPKGLGTHVYFSPLSRETRIAGGPVLLKHTDSEVVREYFLLQDPSIGGYSGAPVFVGVRGYSTGSEFRTAAPTPTCVGLMQGTVSDGTGGKLASVVPGRFVVELLDAAGAE